jgi:hypothetical protein
MEELSDIISRVVNADYGHSRHVMPEQPWWDNLESNFPVGITSSPKMGSVRLDAVQGFERSRGTAPIGRTLPTKLCAEVTQGATNDCCRRRRSTGPAKAFASTLGSLG